MAMTAEMRDGLRELYRVVSVLPHDRGRGDTCEVCRAAMMVNKLIMDDREQRERERIPW